MSQPERDASHVPSESDIPNPWAPSHPPASAQEGFDETTAFTTWRPNHREFYEYYSNVEPPEPMCMRCLRELAAGEFRHVCHTVRGQKPCKFCKDIQHKSCEPLDRRFYRAATQLQHQAALCREHCDEVNFADFHMELLLRGADFNQRVSELRDVPAESYFMLKLSMKLDVIDAMLRYQNNFDPDSDGYEYITLHERANPTPGDARTAPEGYLDKFQHLQKRKEGEKMTSARKNKRALISQTLQAGSQDPDDIFVDSPKTPPEQTAPPTARAAQHATPSPLSKQSPSIARGTKDKGDGRKEQRSPLQSSLTGGLEDEPPRPSQLPVTPRHTFPARRFWPLPSFGSFWATQPQPSAQSPLSPRSRGLGLMEDDSEQDTAASALRTTPKRRRRDPSATEPPARPSKTTRLATSVASSAESRSDASDEGGNTTGLRGSASLPSLEDEELVSRLERGCSLKRRQAAATGHPGGSGAEQNEALGLDDGTVSGSSKPSKSLRAKKKKVETPASQQRSKSRATARTSGRPTLANLDPPPSFHAAPSPYLRRPVHNPTAHSLNLRHRHIPGVASSTRITRRRRGPEPHELFGKALKASIASTEATTPSASTPTIPTQAATTPSGQTKREFEEDESME